MTATTRAECRRGRVSDADADRFEQDLKVLVGRARNRRPSDPTDPVTYRPVPWGPDVRDLLGPEHDR